MFKNIKRNFLKWSIGLLSLYLSLRLRKQRQRRPLDILFIDICLYCLLRKPTPAAFSDETRIRYESTIAETIYWHGTGKFQHDKNGGTIDILRLLINDGGLKPFKDIFDLTKGEMFSISVARDRMYARIYADMHTYRGASQQERYGSPRFWAYYFLMVSNFRAIKELNLWDHKKRREQEKLWRQQGKEFWVTKVTKRDDDASVGYFFNAGSDIENNYPILIGIKRGDYTILETAEYVAQHENRIGSIIPLQSFTHIEVPSNKVAEVESILRNSGNNSIPVFPFEQCEQWWSQKHFSQLVGGF